MPPSLLLSIHLANVIRSGTTANITTAIRIGDRIFRMFLLNISYLLNGCTIS
jgi:hypothetical protein